MTVWTRSSVYGLGILAPSDPLRSGLASNAGWGQAMHNELIAFAMETPSSIGIAMPGEPSLVVLQLLKRIPIASL